MIDRYVLRYFLAVIDQGTFSAAAAYCRVSQPTLSVGIAKLERELSCTLFERNSRRVQLTSEGSRFAVHARRIEAEFVVAESLDRREPTAGKLRLGVLSTIPSSWIGRAIAEVRATNSGEQLEIIEGRDSELLSRMHNGRIDAAITLVRPGVRATELYSEGYALAMSEAHSLASSDIVAAESLVDDVMLVRRHCEVLAETSRHFTARGVRPFMAARTTSDDRVIAYVKAGLGITLMPTSFATEGVAMPRLAGFNLVRTIGVIRSAEPSAQARELAILDTMGAVMRSLASGLIGTDESA